MDFYAGESDSKAHSGPLSPQITFYQYLKTLLLETKKKKERKTLNKELLAVKMQISLFQTIH